MLVHRPWMEVTHQLHWNEMKVLCCCFYGDSASLSLPKHQRVPTCRGAFRAGPSETCSTGFAWKLLLCYPVESNLVLFFVFLFSKRCNFSSLMYKREVVSAEHCGCQPNSKWFWPIYHFPVWPKICNGRFFGRDLRFYFLCLNLPTCL